MWTVLFLLAMYLLNVLSQGRLFQWPYVLVWLWFGPWFVFTVLYDIAAIANAITRFKANG